MEKELEILLLTHGDWGKYIIEAGKMVVGNVDRVSQISLNPSDTFEEFYEKVEKKVSEMAEGSLISLLSILVKTNSAILFPP